MSLNSEKEIKEYVEYQHNTAYKNIDADNILGRLSPAVRVQIKMVQFRGLVEGSPLFARFSDGNKSRRRFQKAHGSSSRLARNIRKPKKVDGVYSGSYGSSGRRHGACVACTVAAAALDAATWPNLTTLSSSSASL